MAINYPQNLPLLPYTPSQNKSLGSLELIKLALQNNELFQNLEPYCISHIAEKMEFEEHLDGDVIIPEDSPGNKVCVVEYGFVQVFRSGAPICLLPPGKVFGELALLFRWNHTVTFKAASNPCHLWTMDGCTLEQILTHGWKRHAYVQFMTSLPLFRHLPEDKLIRLSWQIGEQVYMHGEYIIRQGTHATNFFVIQRGRVKVTIKERENSEKFVRVMSEGEFFGERALLSQQNMESTSSTSNASESMMDGESTTCNVNCATVSRKCSSSSGNGEGGIRTANVIVDDKDGVTCLVIDRDAFYQFFRGLEQVNRRY